MHHLIQIVISLLDEEGAIIATNQLVTGKYLSAEVPPIMLLGLLLRGGVIGVSVLVLNR